MRRALVSAAVALTVAVGGSVALADPDPAGLAQRLGQGVVNQAGADCRIVDSADGRCSTIDKRDIDRAQITAYGASWVHRALTLQRDLSATAPLIEDQLPHTHNTFNSSAYALPANGSAPSYYPTLTNQDPNQAYSISDQLDMDIRAIELDLHWVPSPYGTAATHGYWVTMCHGDGEQVPKAGVYVHVGCSDDRPAQDGFAEVRRWVDAHPGQLVLIYLENQLYDASPVASATLAHDTAATLLEKAFGSLIYRPTGTSPGNCATLPYDKSRAQMLGNPKRSRVLLVGNCGPGAWSSLVFQRGSRWDETGDPSSYNQSNCAADESARNSDRLFRREFEDSTFVTAATNGAPGTPMSPDNVAVMVRCGVNIIGMDQLRPQDGRLAALVWSWATNQPAAAGACAQQGGDGRFTAVSCGLPRPAACQLPTGSWRITSAAVEWRNASNECAFEFPGSRFAVPMNGYRNLMLELAHPGAAAVWLDYAKVRGTWTPWAAAVDSGAGGGSGAPGPGHAYGRGHGKGGPPRAQLW